MKINNKRMIRSLFIFHIVMLILIIIILVGIMLISPEIFRILKYFGLATIIYIIIKISALKYFEYENSGEIVTIKCYGIFRRVHKKGHIEIPLNKVIKIHLEKTFLNNYIIISVRRNNARIIKIHIPVNNMKTRDILKIQDNFEN